ncbi:MAG: LysR family transcriptional regulator [Chloroflexi bacterium]|nr:MAG: LysR family transcriptional regulator [Chloroflexota bacterium]TME87763.1 MAG: LysR family transcriptional regulator [Chloroflexota bacterium]
MAPIGRSDRYDPHVLLAQIESFVEVARSGNMTRAAEALSISQPTLTGRIKSLEQELGAPLFHRMRDGMRLTEAGTAFLPYAERTLAAAAAGSRAVGDLKNGGGVLSIAAAPMVTFTVLPEVVRRFRDRRPRAQLTIRNTASSDAVEMVLRSEATLGITRDIRHPDLDRTMLYEDDLVVIVSPRHRLGGAGSIQVSDLADEEFVLFDRSYVYYELTSALFDGATVVPHGIVTVDNVGAAIRMVHAGLGIGIVPLSGLSDLPAEAVRVLSIAGAKPAALRIVALRRRDAGPPSEAEKELIALLREVGSATAVAGTMNGRGRSAARSSEADRPRTRSAGRGRGA